MELIGRVVGSRHLITWESSPVAVTNDLPNMICFKRHVQLKEEKVLPLCS